MNINITTLSEMKKWVSDFSLQLGSKDIVLLEGPLGAGKSQFVQFLVEAFGGKTTSSPSFAIHNHYSLPKINVEHFDLYRLENDDDLESTGFWDFFGEDEGIICVEWAERIDEKLYPRSWKIHKISIWVSSDLSRIIEYTKLN